jgi:hypothetical protein
MSATKTVYGTDKRPYTLVECDACGGTGKYWRPDIFAWWPCNKCAGHGCLTVSMAQQFTTHPNKDGAYKPRKGVA